MEKVTGIGGFFFRAKDPATVRNWYHQHLGVTLTPTDYEQLPWHQEAGPSAFEPFPADTSYFGRQENGWMINFRVRDLAAIVAQLQAAGLEVTIDPETYPLGALRASTILKAILLSCGNLKAGTKLPVNAARRKSASGEMKRR